ncbi:MAG TPA: FAD-binding oxidoreductase [Acidimicrobiales bacterium]|nr:FAD-binding oxidoreductase [Acidimicrobiales bacterium]
MTMTPEAIKGLRARFRGTLLQPGEEGYEEARRVWNGAVDRRPRLIARCAGADDVVEAVRFARRHDLVVSVRGGGHSIAGLSVCEDGLMIDLSLMKAIRVDPAARRVKAAGGVLWGELDRATQPFGLATTGGVISHTGIAGLTLGGGLGHLMRKHGLTVDNLLSVSLVNAESRLIHVDAESHPDLFWGLRGGGGNFGVATSFEYQLHPVGPMILGGPILWPIDAAADVLRFVSDSVVDAPDELGITVGLVPAPPAPFVPVEWFGKPVAALVLAWVGDHSEGTRALARLRAVATPIADAVRPLPYVALQSLLDGGAPHGRHYYWKAHRLTTLSDDVIDVFIERIASMPGPFCQINGWAVGGAVSRVADDATAVGDRQPGFEISLTAGWAPSDAVGERHKSWVRDGWEALRPHANGVYANFISDEGPAGVEYAYGQRLHRLKALKARHDPENFFHMNANIAPSPRSGEEDP